MENVEHGSLRTFLKVNKESLVKDQELKHLFTIALYHIAQAMDHLHSKMVLVHKLHPCSLQATQLILVWYITLCDHQILHCNLALRNIMVHRFPHEVKVAEFGLARDITTGKSLSGNCKKTDSVRLLAFSNSRAKMTQRHILQWFVLSRKRK